MKPGFYITNADCSRAKNGYVVCIYSKKDAAKYSEINYDKEDILFQFDHYKSEQETQEAALSKLKEVYRTKLEHEDKLEKREQKTQPTKY